MTHSTLKSSVPKSSVSWRKTRLWMTAAVIFSSGFTIGITSFADQKTPADGPIKATMVAFVVEKDKEGKEKLNPATEVIPGQTIEYHVKYENLGDKAISDLAVIGPIPENTNYVPSSALTEGGAFEVSLDGGQNWSAEPVKVVTRDANGKLVERIATPDEYQALRWKIKNPLDIGKAKEYTYRVRVQ